MNLNQLYVRVATATANAIHLPALSEVVFEKTGTPVIGCRVTATLPASVWTLLELVAEQANNDRANYVREANTVVAACSGIHPQLRGLPNGLIPLIMPGLVLQASEGWLRPLFDNSGEQVDPEALNDMTPVTRNGYLRRPESDDAHWSLCELVSDRGITYLLPAAFLTLRPQADSGEFVALHHPRIAPHKTDGAHELVKDNMNDMLERRNLNGIMAFKALEALDRAVKTDLLKAGDVISCNIPADQHERSAGRRAFQVAVHATVEMVRDAATVRHDDFMGLVMLDDMLEFFDSDAWIAAVVQSAQDDGTASRRFEVISQVTNEYAQSIRDRVEGSLDGMTDAEAAELSRDLVVRCTETQEVTRIPSGVVLLEGVLINGDTLQEWQDKRKTA
jgi:hypothetical protein